jgi:hypothetical protein
MVNPVDPNKILLTGENSFIRLLAAEGGAETTRASHWRVLKSPGGPGHVLFLQSDVTDDEVRIYSDNIAMTRWLQATIESVLYAGFADETIPVIDSEFGKTGDGINHWSETIDSLEESLVLTWYDIGEPFILSAAPGEMQGNPHGVYSCLIPCGRAQLTLNSEAASGSPFPEMIGSHQTSTACLAWSETWTHPR